MQSARRSAARRRLGRCGMQAATGWPAAPLRLAARGAMRRAFPSRRILAGANMFNEKPSKGRGRRVCSRG